MPLGLIVAQDCIPHDQIPLILIYTCTIICTARKTSIDIIFINFAANNFVVAISYHAAAFPVREISSNSTFNHLCFILQINAAAHTVWIDLNIGIDIFFCTIVANDTILNNCISFRPNTGTIKSFSTDDSQSI